MRYNAANAGHAGDVILHKDALVVVGEDDLDMDEDAEDKRRASTDKSVSVASDNTTQPLSSAANLEQSRSEAETDEEIRRLRNTVCDRDDEIAELERQLEDARAQIKLLMEAQRLHEIETPSGCFSILGRSGSSGKARRTPATRAESRHKAV